MIVVKSLKESVASDRLPGACSVRDSLSQDFGIHGTVEERGTDSWLCRFGKKEGSPLLGERFCVYSCSE